MNSCDTDRKLRKGPRGFRPLASVWLPVGVLVQAVVRFLPEMDGVPYPGMWMMAAIVSASSLVVLAPCGLPLALGCRRFWRLGRPRTA